MSDLEFYIYFTLISILLIGVACWLDRRDHRRRFYKRQGIMIFIEGQETKISLEQLIEKGRELIASGYPQTTKSFNQDMNEAVTAVHWYDEHHQRWVEENEDDHMRGIRNEARENIARLREGLNKTIQR